MLISKVELGLEFTKETRLKTPSGFIREALKEDDFGSTEEEERIIKRDEKAKFALSWRYSKCSMVQEGNDNGLECIKQFMSFLEIINGVAPIGKLSETTLRVDWIFPVINKISFKKLELEYRKIFIVSGGLFDNAYDSSTVMDMKIGQWTLHHQSGTMKIEQLQKDFSEFKIRDHHPKLFIFLTTELSNNQKTEYSKDNFGQFINSAFQICDSHANDFGKIVGGIL